MVITEPGKVTDRITLLGSLESCVYIVDGGDECMLLGGGLSYIVPGLLRQIRHGVLPIVAEPAVKVAPIGHLPGAPHRVVPRPGTK